MSEESRQLKVIDQAKKAAEKVVKKRKEKNEKSELNSQSDQNQITLKNKRFKNKIPIPEQEDKEQIENDLTGMDKVANWFKNVFTVCGNSSCCASKNPQYDNKTWEDIHDRISTQKEQDMEGTMEMRKTRYTAAAKLQKQHEEDKINDNES